MKESSPSTHKKVVIRKLDKSLVKGYVNPQSYLATGEAEVLDAEGHLMSISLKDIKGIYFVRDFEGDRQRAERKVFISRPKLSGLWIRMTFQDSEILEGLISNNLLDVDSRGFLVTPPDLSSNNLRIFVPRTALSGMEVLGVVTNGTTRRIALARPRRAASTAQIDLFPKASPPEER